MMLTNTARCCTLLRGTTKRLYTTRMGPSSRSNVIINSNGSIGSMSVIIPSSRRFSVLRPDEKPPSHDEISTEGTLGDIGAEHTDRKTTPDENQQQNTLPPPPPSEPKSESASLKMEEIFPWRHETEPLPRLIPGTFENRIDSQLLSSKSISPGNSTLNALTTAFMFMNVPLYQFLFFSSWKAELADSMSWAFTQSVACLLSNFSKVPMEHIVLNTYEISFQKTIGPKTAKTDGDGKQDESNDIDLVPPEAMMEQKFVDLYRTAKNNLSREVEICLKTVPVSAELYSLYCIPYITRNNIKADKQLLEFYNQMLDKPSMDRAPDLNKLRIEHLEGGKMESTVIAQVLVQCNELFYVKDVETGTIVQGHENTKGQNVPHLVRLESVVRTEKNYNGSFENILEDWIITDVDDLLGGNLIL